MSVPFSHADFNPFIFHHASKAIQEGRNCHVRHICTLLEASQAFSHAMLEWICTLSLMLAKLCANWLASLCRIGFSMSISLAVCQSRTHYLFTPFCGTALVGFQKCHNFNCNVFFPPWKTTQWCPTWLVTSLSLTTKGHHHSVSCNPFHPAFYFCGLSGESLEWLTQPCFVPSDRSSTGADKSVSFLSGCSCLLVNLAGIWTDLIACFVLLNWLLHCHCLSTISVLQTNWNWL